MNHTRRWPFPSLNHSGAQVVGGDIKKVGETSSISDPDGVVDLVKVHVPTQRRTTFGVKVNSKPAITSVGKLSRSAIHEYMSGGISFVFAHTARGNRVCTDAGSMLHRPALDRYVTKCKNVECMNAQAVCNACSFWQGLLHIALNLIHIILDEVRSLVPTNTILCRFCPSSFCTSDFSPYPNVALQ